MSHHVTQRHISPSAPADTRPATPVEVHRSAPPPSTTAGRLTTRQRNAIPHILDGYGDDTVAARVGVTRESVNRWRNRHPAFVAELNRQRHLRHAATADRYNALLHQAMGIVEEWQSADGLYLEDKIKTATALLRAAGRRALAPPATPAGPTHPDDVLNQLIADGVDPSPDDSPADDAPPPAPPPPPAPKKNRNPAAPPAPAPAATSIEPPLPL